MDDFEWGMQEGELEFDFATSKLADFELMSSNRRLCFFVEVSAVLFLGLLLLEALQRSQTLVSNQK